MYDIKWIKDNNYLDCYYCRSKNEKGQTILCEFYPYRYNTRNIEFNFEFSIKQKRKINFPEGEITGKDGIKSLIWAYNSLKKAIEIIKSRYPGSILTIWGDDERKRNIYNHYLIPLGFKIRKNRYNELYLIIH